MLYVVLPVHNRVAITEQAIKCITKQTYVDYQIVLIDDGSKDGTAEMVRSYLPETIVLKGNGNLWWGGSLQKGFEWLNKHASEKDICLILNDDTVFRENFFDIGVSLLKQNYRTLFCALCYSQQTQDLLDKHVNFDPKKLSFSPTDDVDDISCLSTRGLFLKFEHWKEIGGFHTIMLPHYLSDYEFTIRAHKMGFNLRVSQELMLSVNELTTGFHDIKYNSIKDYYSKYFSKRNTMNPFYFTCFIILAVPNPYKKFHLAKMPFKLIKGILKPVFRKN